MTESDDQNTRPNQLLRSHEIGFTTADLIECTGCGRANAPNRSLCLYCGAELDGIGITKFDIREPEGWESGFNVVLVDASDADVDRAASVLASLLREERENAKAILANGKSLPLARVESEGQAFGITEKLLDFGVKTLTVADTELNATLPPTRLRSIIFSESELQMTPFGGVVSRSVPCNELVLIVHGVVIERRTESIERRKLRGAKTMSETEMSSDEPVIDLYSMGDPNGWRIPATGFDFSSLGPGKSLIVSENMRRLAAKLVEFCPGATVVDDYMSIRSALEHPWPSESRRDSEMLGIKRKEFSKKLTTSNALQFTKYSRLQWQLYEKKV
jgi:hypothetical protein